MKNAVFWDVAPCRSCVNRPAHAGSSLADFSTPKMEAIHSSETSVHTRRHIPEDGILQVLRRTDHPRSFHHMLSVWYYMDLIENTASSSPSVAAFGFVAGGTRSRSPSVRMCNLIEPFCALLISLI
jgi:hypothetical protein